MTVHGKMRGIATGCLVVALAGCQSWRPAMAADVFDYDGMPDSQYLVGGGYFINYRAPVEGDLYIADDDSNRLLATITLQPGENHELIYDVKDQTLTANLEALGIDPKKAMIKVYFVPR